MFNFGVGKTKTTSTPSSSRKASGFGFGVTKSEPVAPQPAPTVKTAKLPGYLGGGEYKTSGPGSLILTERGYSGLPTKKGEERDHKMSISLGGTSSLENLQYLPTNKQGRQSGKVDVELSAVNDYKAGKISLPEARLKVMMKNQEVQGMIPKQGLFANLLPAITDTGKKFFKNIGEGIKETATLGKDILQALPRATASVSLDALNKQEYTPKSPVAKAVFGTDKIKSAQTETTDTQKTITNFLEKKGVKKEAATSVGLVGAPLFVGLMKGLDVAPVGGGKKVAKEVAEEVVKKTASDVIKTSTVKVLTPKNNLISKLRQSLTPLKYQDAETLAIFKKYNAEILKSQEIANAQIPKLKKEGKKAFDNILQYEKGKPVPQGEAIKREFDVLHSESLKRGVDIGYQENYVPHVYNNSPKEIKTAMSKYMKDQGVNEQIIKNYLEEGKDLPDDVANALKIHPSASKARVLPNYETAVKYGLKPKYSEPAEFLAHSTYDLEKITANKNLINSLEEAGKITTRPAHGFEPVNLPFSTKGYYAKPELAKMLNGVFQNADQLSFGQKLVKTTGDISKFAQNVVLSAGLPKTHANFFTAGQLLKDLTAGNVSSAKAFVRAFSNKSSAKWFMKNQQVLKDIAEEGINMGDRVVNFQHIYKTFKNTKGFSQAVGHAWHKTFDEKTFASFMPQMYAETFKSVQRKALKKGLGASEARKLAGDTIKNFYGLMENVGRSKTAEDTLSTVFFAPRFREGIIRTLAKTLQSINPINLRNPAFAKNRKLIVGLIITYAGYDALNRKTAGNSLHENPPGHEFELMIKRKNGDVIYVPYMPSFLSVPRNLTSAGIALSKGDLATTTNKLGQNLSIPIKTASEALSNKDYFGNPIYSETDTPSERIKKIATYIGLSINHPYVEELYRLMKEDQPLYQTVSKMLELPLKFSSMDKVQKAEFYEAMKIKELERKKEREAFKPVYDEIQSVLLTDKEKATQMVNELSEEDYKKYTTIKATEKAKATKELKAKMLPVFQEIQDLLASGNKEEAQARVNAMDDEEYKIYQSLKKSLE